MKNPPRVYLRGFDAARTDRLAGNWSVNLPSLNQLLFMQLQPLRARSRDHAFNNDYVKRWLRSCKTHIVGPAGPSFQNKARMRSGRKPDHKVNKAIETAFREWGKRDTCDVAGKLSWVDLLKLVVEVVARDGEALIRMVRGFDNKYGFALQVIDPDLLDIYHNDPAKKIRMGIQFDDWGRPLGYYLLKHNPNDWYTSETYAQQGQHDYVPATDMIHLFETISPGQLRGLPWNHTALFRLQRVSEIEIAELVAAETSSKKMGFFERNELGESPYEGKEKSEDGEYIEEAQAGEFGILPKGVTFKPWDPTHPSGNFAPFLKGNLKGAGAGLEVSYPTWSNDLEGVNFSSIRAGRLEDVDIWRDKQRWLFQDLDRIAETFIQMATLRGVFKFGYTDLERVFKPTWQGRGWDWVDPQKEISAQAEAVKNRFTSISAIIRSTGRDPEDVFQEIAADEERLAELNILLSFLAPSPALDDAKDGGDNAKTEE